jgi:hypothetical protein
VLVGLQECLQGSASKAYKLCSKHSNQHPSANLTMETWTQVAGVLAADLQGLNGQ